jgi:hypothetical protein
MFKLVTTTLTNSVVGQLSHKESRGALDHPGRYINGYI